MIFTENELAVGCKCLTTISAGDIGKRDVHLGSCRGNLSTGLDAARTAAAAHKPGDPQANRQPCST
jgi:hypothetical protein